MPVFALISQGLALLPGLIQAGMSAKGLIDLMKGAADRGDGNVTDEEWAQLHEIENALREKLQSDDK